LAVFWETYVPISTLLLATCLLGSTSAASDSAVAFPNRGFHAMGSRGLSQTISAEPLGEGIVLGSVQLATNPTAYPVFRTNMTPPYEAYVTTILVSGALGLTSNLDVSAWGAAYSIPDWKSNPQRTGFGSSGLALQYSPAFSWEIPLRLAIQGGLIAGTTAHPVHSGFDTARGDLYSDGYSYFLTRMGNDGALRLLQTVTLTPWNTTVVVHANEGFVVSLETNRDVLRVFDGGVAVTPHPLVTLGLEGHVRTRATNGEATTDPRWITTSAALHTPIGLDVTLGADISESDKRPKGPRRHALDPWRAFVQVAMPYDVLARIRERTAARQKYEADSLENERRQLQARLQENERNARQMRETRARLDSIAQGMTQNSQISRRDSIEAAQAKLSSEIYKRRADSLNAYMQQDSLRRLEAERIKAERRIRNGNLEVELRTSGTQILDGIYFVGNSAAISSISQPYLKLLGAILVKYPQLRLEIGGHTDNQASAKTSASLSQQRAEAVRTFLTAKYPALKGKLAAKGYGSSQPLATNGTEEGRATNRRIELTVLNPDKLPTLRGR